MSVRSIIATGLLAAGAVASPQWGGGWGYPKTVTVTSDHTVYKTVTKTGSCSGSSVTSFSSSSSHSSSASTSASASKSGSSSGSSSASSSASSSTSTVATTTTTSASNTVPTTTLLATATGHPLDVAAKAAGKLWFGTAADIPGTGEAQDPYWAAEFNSTDFGEATPANIMKFVFTEPEPNVFNYTGAEQFLSFVEGTGKLVRCHNLIWQSELPTWITNPTVNWTNATLTAALRNHVTNLVEYFGDRCYSWDVVNEAFSDNPAGAYASNVWFDTIGPAYVVEAFDAATQAVKAKNLAVKLYYNDYNIEYLGNKSYAAQNLVTELKGRGIQIDGVGLESHFIAGETPDKASQMANMQAFINLGVDVAITELDVRLNLPPNATTEAQQVLDYYNSVAACVAVGDGCIGVTVWDFDDEYSWVPGTFPGQGYADLFLSNGPNEPLTRKAAYDGCLQALTGAPESA
ncbi:hypothetical protein LTR62_008458 [Meristemomyces frigidus]|uniref:Beta-xylanase n=1 Tax=Meristemomyces frigidus TaxID=1508187 RepID=A0AAN7YIJ3_9PEZI|nr:hypothetical protein LTR62_008458 [Meristemomyces frigidus]